MKLFFTLLFSIVLFVAGAQTPAGDSTLLIPSVFFTNQGLVLSQSNQTLRLYTNKAYTRASLNMVYDIRMVFNSGPEAKTFLDQNLEKFSEGGVEYKKRIKLPNATDIHIYREAPAISSFNKSMGLPHAQWCIIFAIDRVVVKIFTSGEFTAFVEPYTIALEAARHVSATLGKIPDALEYNVSETVLAAGFLQKIKEAKVQFRIPSGFENHNLPENLEAYYDQEFAYPGENMIVRTFIVNQENKRDTGSYKDFCRFKGGAASSVYFNIFMPIMKKSAMPTIKETDDSLECKKKFNGDFMVEAVSEISKNSVLGKGYKYAYFVAVYKRGYGDCYTIYFANDMRTLTLFPQLMNRSFWFLD